MPNYSLDKLVSQCTYGEIIRAVEDTIPLDANALTHGDERVTWSQLKHRTNNLYVSLRAHGIAAGDQVGFYLRNSTAYSEVLVSAFKFGLSHVNINFRYKEKELSYIIDNSDSTVVFYSREFRDNVDKIRHDLPGVKLWVETDSDACPAWAHLYRDLIDHHDGSDVGYEANGDEMLLLYTGGTTGMPKGVMWKHRNLLGASNPLYINAPDRKTFTLRDYVAIVASRHPNQRALPACPMMHGTGLISSINTLIVGGSIVTLTGNKFDTIEMWDTVDREKVQVTAIVGDAFAKPMLKALDEEPNRWDISSLGNMISSGVMWSQEVKAGLLRHNSEVSLADSFGASEAIGLGSSISNKKSTAKVAKFMIGEFAKVFTEGDFREIQPGSDEVGFIALSGNIPSGYYKDPVKTEKVFPTIRGVQYSMPGDYCRVQADGSVILLGRGSACINSGGEKIYPEEIEETLKLHSGVLDALVVGLDDEKWGQSVTAVITIDPEHSPQATEHELIEFVKSQLAAYKSPKRVFITDDLKRAANGKADYKFIRDYAQQQMAAK